MVGPLANLIGAICAFGAWWWIWLLIDAVRHRRDLVRLDEVEPSKPAAGWPSVAVVFAARDEDATVERATRSMLALDVPGLRVVAVDDRSRDATGAILDRLARDDGRLTAVHVTALPPGWLGKTHALQAGADALGGRVDWILFTDADVVFAPDALRRALTVALRDGLDHLAAAPEVVTTSFGERVFMGFFSLLFALGSPPWRVADRRSRAAVGVGAFNLVRAEAFRDIGGFSHIALSVDDDMMLGKAMKFAGYRCGAIVGGAALSVRGHVGMMGMVRGLEKNFFGATGYRLPLIIGGIGVATVLGLLPFVGLMVGPWWTRLWCGAGVLALVLMYGQSRGFNGLAWYHALAMPLAALALILAMIRSTVLTYARGGVRWRDSLYPLADLRDHCRRRDAWLRELWLSTR